MLVCSSQSPSLSRSLSNMIRHAVRAWRSRTCTQHFRVCSSDASYRGEIGEVSGIPREHLKRRVVIYSPARTASQQGSANTGKWKINFNSTEKWENPLMGWTSTGDPYANVGEGLTFDSKEAAIEFVNKHGWDFMVKEPHRPIIKAKAYADNFKYKGPPNPETN